MAKKILIVSAPYYKDIVDGLIFAAKKYLEDKTEIEISEEIAPGAFEIERRLKDIESLTIYISSLFMIN